MWHSETAPGKKTLRVKPATAGPALGKIALSSTIISRRKTGRIKTLMKGLTELDQRRILLSSAVSFVIDVAVALITQLNFPFIVLAKTNLHFCFV